MLGDLEHSALGWYFIINDLQSKPLGQFIKFTNGTKPGELLIMLV